MTRTLRLLSAALVGAFALVAPGAAVAATTVIDFENLNGPSFFCGAPDSPLVIGDVTLTGGKVMTAVSNLPANRTTVYGTSSCPGFSRTLTIAFARPVNQVSLDVYNGIGASVDYTVVSDGGSVQTKTLAPHVQSGQARFTIRDRGIGSVTISDGLDGFWDFFIDNISYSSDSSLLDLPPEVLLQMYLSGQITFEQLQQAWAELARRYIPPVTAGCSITQDRSLPSTTTSEITFVNESGQVVDIYWINFNGDFVLYNTLQPGGSYVQRTFLNHAWVVRTKAGQCIGYTISDAPSKTYVIQTSGGGGRPG